MAERRMFAKTIIDSDAFIDMPVTSRLLYYDLSMRADDDGFINAPKKIMRMIGASEDDLRILAQRKFIIPFDTGVVVIKHWRIHNYIRKDTYRETAYKDLKNQLEYDENNAYRFPSTERPRLVDEPSTERIRGVDAGKDSIGQSYREDSTEIVKDNINNSLVLYSAETFQKSAEIVENSVERTTRAVEDAGPYGEVSAEIERTMKSPSNVGVSADEHERLAGILERAGLKDGAAYHREEAARIRRQSK